MRVCEEKRIKNDHTEVGYEVGDGTIPTTTWSKLIRNFCMPAFPPAIDLLQLIHQPSA